MHGSGNLARTLIRHGLVDEYHLWLFPVVLGQGKRLFADGTLPSTLRLVDSMVSKTGVFMGTYEPAGEVVTGTSNGANDRSWAHDDDVLGDFYGWARVSTCEP